MSFLRETEYCPITGETKKWFFEDDGSITCERSIDLTKMIDACKAEANITRGFARDKKFHKVASIPPIVQHEILKEYNLDILGTSDPAELQKIERIIELEYPAFKTNDSKLWRPT